MAEPARRIYDQDQPEKNIRPDLRAVEGNSGQTPENLREAEEDANSEGKGVEPTKEGTEDLGSNEQAAAEDSGSFYKKSGKSKAGLRGRLTTRRNVIMGSAAAIVIALVIGFMFILPLKIMHIVTNLQSHFFSTAESAVEKETDHLFGSYVKHNVMAALRQNKCRSTKIDRFCSVASTGSSLPAALYNGWKDARLENKLADKYGLEFHKQGGQIYMKTPDLPGNGIDISDLDSPGSKKDLNDFIPTSRKEARRAVRNAVKNETFVIRSMYKYKVLNLLKKKYGVKFCIIACDTRDDFNDKVDNKKRAAKLFLIQRVLVPRAEGLGLVMMCVMEPTCKPDVHDPADPGGVNGEKRTQFQKDLQAMLTDYRARYGAKKLDDLFKENEDILKNGYSRYLIKTLLGSLFGELAEKEAVNKAFTSAVPLAGWANLAFSTIDSISQGGKKIRILAYGLNSAAMVQVFSMYRTVADEIKAGHMDATELGSFVNSLGPGAQKGGGGVTAEGTPLYNALLGDTSPTASSTLLSSLLPGKAYAAELASTKTYLCDSEKPVPAGKLICPEENLRLGNATLDEIAKSVPESVKALAKLWNATAGKLFDWVGGFIGNILGFIAGILDNFASHIPGYDSLKDLLQDSIGALMNFIVNKLVPSPISDNMSGGRTFDMLAGGADASANQFAHHGLGGKVLSDQEVAQIRAEQQADGQAELASRGRLARFFDTSSQYSFVSRLALAMPSDLSTAQNTLSSFISNPLAKLFGGMSLPLMSSQAQAAPLKNDPFGVTQYGYPTNDPVFKDDPEEYWEKNCVDGAKTEAWNLDAIKPENVDPDTGDGINKTTNGCLLLQATVGSAGAFFTDAVLTADDLVDESSVGVGVPSGVAAGGIVDTALYLAWPGPHEPKTEAKPTYLAAPPTNTSSSVCFGADCGVFVSTVMRRSGADPSYPSSGTAAQEDHVKKYPELYDVVQLGPQNSIADLLPGDILIVNKGAGIGASGHTYIYIGGGKQASASWSSICSNSRMPSVGPAEIFDTSGLNRGYYLRARLISPP